MNRLFRLGLAVALALAPACVHAQDSLRGARSAAVERTKTAAKTERSQKARRSAERERRRHVRKHINLRRQAERRGFRKVSSLVNFPTFFPGIGILYVKPNTLPHGPFLAFDRRDRLISTIYMVPLDEMEQHKSIDFDRLRYGADHVTMYFNPGHPGVDTPHYHVVVWHVSRAQEKLVAR